MIDKFLKMEGVEILPESFLSKISGRGPCGYKTSDGVWHKAVDHNGDGLTYDDAVYEIDYGGAIAWCCDSCSWNQPKTLAPA